MLRWLATIVILGLMVLAFFLPDTSLGRRGSEAGTRAEAPDSFELLGKPFPELALLDLDGKPISWESLRGHRVLVTLERSVDW
ncbi:MAG: hypothetical protein JRG95_18410 [Deltaproteobacteria bacterium]|nr:hypothetical protein [Deltaproteobacteria bacterium]